MPADRERAQRPARELLSRGWIERPATRRRARRPFVATIRPHRAAGGGGRRDQRRRSAYKSFLLHGITGSGKTEIYLHAIAAALAPGRQALVLVPEINLTPRLDRRVRRALPGRARGHAAQRTRRRRTRQGVAAVQSGEADIVLGTRLAVFAPLPTLGLMIVDEEQDASFKQQDGVRYSARDVAVFRAHAAGVPVVLGSATPSLETYAARTHRAATRCSNCRTRAPRRRGLPTDAPGRPAQREARGRRCRPRSPRRCAHASRAANSPWSSSTAAAIAPVLVCGAALGERLPALLRALVLHLAERTLRCHHCGFAHAVPRALPDLRQRRPRALRPRHATAGRQRSRRAFPTRACCASIGHDAQQRQPRGDVRRASAAGEPTSSSARRSSPKATTSRI